MHEAWMIIQMMGRTLRCLSLVQALATGLGAAPAIGINGVVNAASFKPVGVPGSALAQGSLMSIFGAGLGPADGVSATSFPLSTQLGGVSIRVSGSGGVAVEAIPVFVSARQINAILPSNTPLGEATVAVTYQNETSPPARVDVASASPGLFSAAGNGIGPARFQNLLTDGTQPLNALSSPARPGQVLVAYGTGLGAINAPDNIAPPVGEIPNLPVEVLVGGRPARKIYAGRSSCCAGLDQLNVELPVDVPTGCYVPVQIKAGAFWSNVVSAAISASGGPCSDPLNPLASFIANSGGSSVGILVLTRSVLRLTVAGRNLDSTFDSGEAFFFRADENSFTTELSLPPVGGCSVWTFRGTDAQMGGMSRSPFPLEDAGTTLRIQGPRGEKRLPREAQGNYFATLGGGLDLPGQPPPAPLYLVAGRYTATAAGGAAIGALTANADLPDPAAWTLTWTNRDQIATINRNQPLQLTWRGGDTIGGVAVIAGSSSNTSLGVGGSFLCTAALRSGSFEIPASILGSLPQTNSTSGIPAGTLQIGASSLLTAPTFIAPGLDRGVFYYRSAVSRVVSYQ